MGGKWLAWAGAALVVLYLAGPLLGQECAGGLEARVGAEVRAVVARIEREYQVPGMAVAVTVDGRRLFFSFGVAERDSGRRVDEETIFEIGSVSKVFTAMLVAYAEARGQLGWSESVSRLMPELAGTSFDRVNVLNLATYTAGGLPLQFPDGVKSERDMVAFYRGWRPERPPGAFRVYSNPSIGLAGHLAAQRLGGSFTEWLERRLFPMMGLRETFVVVPEERQSDYAYGYNAEGKAVRVTPGVLDAEAYGVKTSARSLIGMVEQVMSPGQIRDGDLRKAVEASRRGYFRIGRTTQGLGWEMYDWPVAVEDLVAGNSAKMAMEANAAEAIVPPGPVRDDVLLNKTGSTNGFGAYVAMAPGRRMGIVMLANRNYPNAARVRAAHRILMGIEACRAR
ncbi:MAG: beta-lactamase [Bryobacter sp.]|nr:beta-lactamase [Bryobacter sp. CoA8 C33]